MHSYVCVYIHTHIYIDIYTYIHINSGIVARFGPFEVAFLICAANFLPMLALTPQKVLVRSSY